VHKGIGPLSINLTDFARSLPSLHQLLPSYACVSVGADLAPLTGLPGIDTNRLNDALHFYQQLEAIEASDTGSASRRHLITGSRQRTASTVTISNGVVRLLDSYQGDDLAGDGTVPTVSLPFGLPLDDNTIHHIADKHGDLQCNPAVLDEIEAILLAKSIVPKALALAELRVDAPDLLLAGQDLVVTVNECRRPVTVTLTDEHGDPTVQLPRPDGAGGLVSVFHALPPGGYTLTAAGRMPGLVSPVTSDLVVWPPDLGTAPLG
jgi:hypothetical protein